MKQKILIITIICLMSVFSLFAQPTITFIPSDGVTLTRADVDSTLEANGLTRESEFHAVSDAEKIGTSAFMNCYNLEMINFSVSKLIGGNAFYRCESLIDANFPAVRLIDNSAFMHCENLTSINFPSIAKIGHLVFAQCFSLISASFGTVFETETEIEFGWAVFGDFSIDGGPILTPNINLILGKYVLPLPDTIANIWQNTNRTPITDYVWKSITIHTGIKEEIDNSYIYYLGNNYYKLENINKSEIFNLMGILVVTFNEQEIIDLNNISSGCYFLKYLTDNNKIITEKIIKN